MYHRSVDKITVKMSLMGQGHKAQRGHNILPKRQKVLIDFIKNTCKYYIYFRLLLVYKLVLFLVKT
jgi:hypothetical protein